MAVFGWGLLRTAMAGWIAAPAIGASTTAPSQLQRRRARAEVVDDLDQGRPGVAVAFGMDPEAAMIYLADHVDPTRLPNNETVGAEAFVP